MGNRLFSPLKNLLLATCLISTAGCGQSESLFSSLFFENQKDYSLPRQNDEADKETLKTLQGVDALASSNGKVAPSTSTPKAKKQAIEKNDFFQPGKVVRPFTFHYDTGKHFRKSEIAVVRPVSTESKNQENAFVSVLSGITSFFKSPVIVGKDSGKDISETNRTIGTVVLPNPQNINKEKLPKVFIGAKTKMTSTKTRNKEKNKPVTAPTQKVISKQLFENELRAFADSSNVISGQKNSKVKKSASKPSLSSNSDMFQTLSSLFSSPTAPEVGRFNSILRKTNVKSNAKTFDESQMALVDSGNKYSVIAPDAELVKTLESLFNSPVTPESGKKESELASIKQTQLATVGNLHNTLTIAPPKPSKGLSATTPKNNFSTKQNATGLNHPSPKKENLINNGSSPERILGAIKNLLSPDPLQSPSKKTLHGKNRQINASQKLANVVPEGQLDMAHFTAQKEILPTVKSPIQITPLIDAKLRLGSNIVLGRELDLARQGPAGCIEKSFANAHFCVEPISWPANTANLFNISSAIYIGEQAVVRYDRGRASQAYTMFPVEKFVNVVKHLQKLFGPPSARDIVWMHMLEAPRIPNPTFRWVTKSSDGEVETLLEVRNFDNYRKPYPDTKNGFILLTRKGVPDMFSHLSTMDLMRLEKRRISMTPLNITSQ
ncbi:MAG: hypothetical protein CFH06_01013 [Alphaproteobacteria bacterium MarineAlpha3_Bin5]|nr:hypothetical protein [Magnetovibrio sp.]PPR77980.1 MAG: hypothetical protein CFH06_01013 [Alphaproteobacteria bacterium MarineAlpha3_Bin5]